MSWAFLSLRKMQLKQAESKYQARLIQISKKIQNLAKLADAVADGKITYQEAAGSSSSMFGTQMNFLANSSNMAYQSAQIKTNAYLNQMNAINQQTGGQYSYALGNTSSAFMQNGQIQPYLVFNQIYQEELKSYADEYAKTLNREEEDLQAEKLTIETQIKAIQAEYQSVEQQEGENIKNDAIKLS